MKGLETIRAENEPRKYHSRHEVIPRMRTAISTLVLELVTKHDATIAETHAALAEVLREFAGMAVRQEREDEERRERRRKK